MKSKKSSLNAQNPPTRPPAHPPTGPPAHRPTSPPAHRPTGPPAHLHTCPPAPFATGVAFWLGILLFAVYLLSFSGKLHVMDELAVFSAGNNLAQHAQADINNLIWTNHWTPNPPGVWGADSNLYTKKAPGISFLAAPLIWLGHLLPALNAVHFGLLLNLIVTAMTAAFLFLWLEDLAFSRFTAFFTALLYGLGTMAWVYARMFWGLSVAGLLFLLAIWAAYRLSRGEANRNEATGANNLRSDLPRPYHPMRWALLAGAAMALSVAMRFESLAAAGLLAGYLVVQSSKFKIKNWSLVIGHWSLVIGYALPVVLMLAALFIFNQMRFGSLGETGYTQEISFSAPWTGAFGLLFSPGNGLFIYSPVLLLVFFGLRPAWKRLPRLYFWLIVSISLFYLLFYGSWFSWGGTWGWGPRFLLPVLPLLMVFVAFAVSSFRFRVSGSAIQNLKLVALVALITLSLAINLLGLVIDFNDYYNQLSSNDDFVFNWAKFPPLAHWQILQAGGNIDLIWLYGNRLHLHLLLPPLVILLMAVFNLWILLISSQRSAVSGQRSALRNRWSTSPGAALAISVFLTLLMLAGAGHLALAEPQTQADALLLETLNAEFLPGDALLTAMPPFADAQEFSTRLMAYQDRPLPHFAWIEYGPRAIQADEREQVWQATGNFRRVWLFERWLGHADPLSESARYLEQNAFPVQEAWFENSGKLTLYALASADAPKISLNTPFAGGLTLLDFSLLNEEFVAGEILKLRLTWQAEAANSAAGLPPGPTVAFVQLVAEDGGQAAAQQDRLLIDLQAVKQSPLLPGQTISQGYGLRLPPDLSPGAYYLIVGLYDAATTQRLPRANNPDDFLYLSTVTVNSEK